jgi:sec-independent protein translocase protein TatB
MFDFAWSELALIAVVAMIAIGPKDMPGAIRAVTGWVKKARRMAAEFQTHVDEMVREADLGDVKKAFSDIRNLDIPSLMEKHVDPDHSIRNTFAEDPLKPTYPTASEVSTLDEVAVADQSIPEPGPQPEVAAESEKPLAPAFIPPGLVPPPVTEAAAPPAEAPAFIPPEAVLRRQSKA